MARLICTLGAWYAPIYSFLVRIVHPIAFGALAMSLLLVLRHSLGLILDGDLYVLIIAFTIGILAYAHSIALTPRLALVAVVLSAGWAWAIHGGHVANWLLVGLYLAAAVSLAARIAAIARMAPTRARTDLLHLVLPASLGTLVGLVPVVLGGAALMAGGGSHPVAEGIAILMLIGAMVAALGFALLHVVLASQGQVVARWCMAGGMQRRGDTAGGSPLGDNASGIGTWARANGTASVEVTSGAVRTTYPDLPVAWLTVVSVRGDAGQVRPGDVDVWLRSRSFVLDTVAPAALSTDHLRTESIELEDGHEVHVHGGTDPIVALQELDPRVVDVARGLGSLQLARSGNVISVYAVGGAAGPEELDRMLHIATAAAAAFDLPVEPPGGDEDASPATSSPSS